MLYEIKKAFEAFKHPGIETTLYNLVTNGIKYYVSPSYKSKPPLTLYFSINSVCNLKCKMCDVGMDDEEGTFFKNLRVDKKLYEIDIEVFKSVIDEIASYKPFISITSTEPLMYKKLPDAIKYCRNKGLKVAVTTGGYMLPKKAEALAEAGLSRLNVSIDGPSKIHNGIRGRPDSFERDLEGIKLFEKKSRELGNEFEVNVNYVISNMNYKYLTETAGILLKELPLKMLNFTYLWFIDPSIAAEHNADFGDKFPITTSCFNEFSQPKDVDVDVLYSQIEQLIGVPKVNFLPHFTKPQLEKYFHHPEEFMNKSAKCYASWFFTQILADGRVIPYTRCHNESFGNINEEKFMDIWNGPKMREWRRFIKKQKKMPMCRRCDLVC